LKDYSIGPETKIHLVVLKKDTNNSSSVINISTTNQPTTITQSKPQQSSNFIKELQKLAEPFVTDVNLFATIFTKELKNLANQMSLDDIERYAESRELLTNNDNLNK
jgi:hypothetical protein